MLSLTSVKTKLAGLATILTAIGGALAALTDGNNATNPDWTTVAAAITAGVGLMFSRENRVPSEVVMQKTEMVETDSSLPANAPPK